METPISILYKDIIKKFDILIEIFSICEPLLSLNSAKYSIFLLERDKLYELYDIFSNECMSLLDKDDLFKTFFISQDYENKINMIAQYIKTNIIEDNRNNIQKKCQIYLQQFHQIKISIKQKIEILKCPDCNSDMIYNSYNYTCKCGQTIEVFEKKESINDNACNYNNYSPITR